MVAVFVVSSFCFSWMRAVEGAAGGDGKVRAMAEEADPEPGTLATNLRLDERGKDIEGKTYYEAENGIVD